MSYPERLEAVLETFDMFPDQSDRTNMLLSYADQFREVPAEVATRPFDTSHHVPQCESDAYVWALKRPDGNVSRLSLDADMDRKYLHKLLRKYGITGSEPDGDDN